MIRETVSKIADLDYPRNLVQVLVIVERDDIATRRHLLSVGLPENFLLVEIPSLIPFTKGRALQHALPLVTGEILAVFDAESRPNRSQLLSAVSHIKNEANACYQSEIVVSNATGKGCTYWLNKVEFFEWFAIYMSYSDNSAIHFRLAGNSFHIATELLRKVGGWDPFSVTEDADLSYRLIRCGVRIRKMKWSWSCESCPDKISSWIKQRVRWYKGLYISNAVHCAGLLSRLIGSHGIASGLYRWVCLVSFSAIPLIVIICQWCMVSIGIRADAYAPGFWLIMLLFMTLFVVNVSLSVHSSSACKKNDSNGSISSIPLLLISIQFYWLLHILSGWIAVIEYLVSPLIWHKTEHAEG